jgi:protocatechuate 3,4-dioxygenase, alpha subunit
LSEPTPSQTVGPFFGFALPYADGPSAVPAGTPGSLRIEGQVLDGEGGPVPDALLELSQAGVQGSDARGREGRGTFGRCPTDPEGSYWFTTVKPGRIRTADGGLQAPHLTITVFARGLLRHLVTRIYFPDEAEANTEDPLLNLLEEPRRRLLIAHPDSSGVLRFDIHLQGPQETPFFDL